MSVLLRDISNTAFDMVRLRGVPVPTLVCQLTFPGSVARA